MTELFRLKIRSQHSLDHAWHVLEKQGWTVLYGTEDEEGKEIFAYLTSASDMVAYHWIESCTPYTLPPVDWKAEWASQCPHFFQGQLHVDFSSLGKQAPRLKLNPGPGFGNLSHPTTRLMLNFLSEILNDQVVVDIGCGSGILTLASGALGAQAAYGIDIDPDAISHSNENARLNQLEKKCQFFLSDDFSWKVVAQPILILMNMIQTEQQCAWHSLSSLHDQAALCLTSGIQSEEKQAYLTFAKQRNWLLLAEKEENGWHAFCFCNDET